jgi:hypothetical protein
MLQKPHDICLLAGRKNVADKPVMRGYATGGLALSAGSGR